MRAVWLCVLLLQAWAAPIAFAEADHMRSDTSDIAINQDDSMTVGDASFEVDSESFRTLLRKKPSSKKSKSKSKKQSSEHSKKKSSKKSSKKSKKKSPKAKRGKPGKKGAPGPPGDNAVPAVPAVPSKPGTPGTPGASGAPGAPGASGTPGTPASISGLFQLGDVQRITTAAYTGLAVDGTPSGLANIGLPSLVVEVTLNSDYTTLIANTTALNAAVLDARAAVTAAVFGPDEEGSLPLYLVQVLDVRPGSIKINFKVFTPYPCGSFTIKIAQKLAFLRAYVTFSCVAPPTVIPSPLAGR